jgi:elongation factor G
MKEYKTENIRNISIIGSSQIGKTSLGETLLFNAKKTTRLGSVNDGTSILDYGSQEIQKKFTISSSTFFIDTENSKLNFIDTPGYPAFVSQVVTAVNVCESSLIVIDADAGVEVLTKKVWRLAREEKQSQFIFINRMDHERADFDVALEKIKAFTPKAQPIIIPIGSGANLTGVVDIIKQKAYVDNGDKIEERDIPEELKARATELKSSLIEAAAENSEELLEKYLDAGELSDEDLITGLKLGINSRDIIPLMAGSVLKNIGLRKLQEYLELLAPNPKEKQKQIVCKKGDAEEIITIGSQEETILRIYKITDDGKTGEVYHFKLISGKIGSSMELVNIAGAQKERLGHIFLFAGKTRYDASNMNAGDIGATAKLKSVQIGNTLVSGKSAIKLPPFKFPGAIISQAIEAESEKDRGKLGEGLLALNRIDPCFRTERRPEFDEIIVSGMSKLHLQLFLDKLKNKYKIELKLEKPKIPYRETISSKAKAQGKYKKQTGGHGQYGDCCIEIAALPIGSGFSFLNEISGGVIPSKYIPAVEKGIKAAMNKGIVAGFPLVDIQVTLYDGSYHAVDSSDLAFQMAGSLALKKAAEQATPTLLEPIMEVEVIIPDNFVGDISADFNQRRGKILSMDALEDGSKSIKALVPLAEMYQYSVDLKSMTKGEGTYTQEFNKYETVPSNVSQKLVAATTEAKEE